MEKYILWHSNNIEVRKYVFNYTEIRSTYQLFSIIYYDGQEEKKSVFTTVYFAL